MSGRKAGNVACRHPTALSRSTGTGSAARFRIRTLWYGECLLRGGTQGWPPLHLAHPGSIGLGTGRFLCEVAMQCPASKTIHLVMDNLNTHHCKSLVDAFGEAVGTEICDRFTIHYTPTHGSWLNQAEIEISLFARQCLGKRRIPDLKTLRRETRLWNRGMNRDRKKINWRFDRRAARLKFGYKTLNKSFKRSKT
jgi:DDE superfamily endonuclease